MLLQKRAAFATATEHGHLVLRARLSLFSSLSRDVAEANRELDDFFGVSHTNGIRSPAPASGHQTLGGDAFPSFSDPSTLQRTANHSGHDVTTSVNTDGPLSSNLQLGRDVSSPYGFAAAAAASNAAAAMPPGMEEHRAHTHIAPQQHLQSQPQPQAPALTHIDASGSAFMVDVSQKLVTVREAQASCVVRLGAAYDLVASNAVAKGDVLKVAQLAGICGAKATASLIPLCHNIPISKMDVQLELDPVARTVVVRALARTDGKTGVEMEALTAASVAALTVYDMCKATAKDIVVGQLQLDYKSGGRSGTYLRAGLRRTDLLPSARPPL